MNPEVRRSEPSRALPSLARGDEAEEISTVTVLCFYLAVCIDFLRTDLAVFTVFPADPRAQNKQPAARTSAGDGTSGQRRSEGTGAPYRGGWISP